VWLDDKMSTVDRCSSTWRWVPHGSELGVYWAPYSYVYQTFCGVKEDHVYQTLCGVKEAQIVDLPSATNNPTPPAFTSSFFLNLYGLNLHKRLYRQIDFRCNKENISGEIVTQCHGHKPVAFLSVDPSTLNLHSTLTIHPNETKSFRPGLLPFERDRVSVPAYLTEGY